MPLLCDLQCRRLKGADQAAPIQIRQNISDDLAPKLTALHLLLAVKCSHFVNLLMFLFVLAKLLPKSHNLYGNSLDFKLKIYERKKNEYMTHLMNLRSNKVITKDSCSSPPVKKHFVVPIQVPQDVDGGQLFVYNEDRSVLGGLEREFNPQVVIAHF